MSKIGICFCMHDDAYYLAGSIESVRAGGDLFAFASRVPWHDQPGDWEACAKVARQAGAKVVVGEWRSELEHREAALGCLLKKGYTHALIPDGDEIMDRGSRKAAKSAKERRKCNRFSTVFDDADSSDLMTIQLLNRAYKR